MNTASPRFFRVWFWVGVLLTAYKLWLTRAQSVYAIAGAAHDDRLFLLLAESIVRGDWLGAYSQMTLAKGPFYSLWIAAMYWVGLPLGLSVQLAYAGACALFARACRPAIRCPRCGAPIDVTKAVTEAKAGRVEYRVDSTGIVHVAVGKVSFGAAKLEENARAVVASIKAAKPASVKSSYVKAVHFATSMGPSITVAISEI